MWINCDGDPTYVLPPKHAALFRIAAGFLSDNVGWDADHEDEETGIPAYDRLTQGQKQSAILQISRAVLRSDVESPRINAALAATLDVIYLDLQALVECEISQGDGNIEIRSLLLEAMTECGYWEDVKDAYDPGEEPEPPPSPSCDDADVWEELVETLRTTLLQDYDFDMEDDFLDMPPEAAAQLKKNMNIDPEYFVSNPDDPTPAQLIDIQRQLRLELGNP